MTNEKYAIPSKVPYARPVQPIILLILNNATGVELYKLKQVYDKNLLVFHEVRGVKQALIQQVVTEFNEQYTISTKNLTTGQFMVSIRQIFAYLLATYGKMSPRYLNDLKKEVTEMNYDPVTPVNKVFNKVEDILK